MVKNSKVRILWLTLMCLVAASGCSLFARLLPMPLPTDSNLEIDVVVNQASGPVDLAFSADGRVFYTEKATGNIRVIKNGALLPTPFVTVACNTFGERGTLGIALHPNFADNNFVYLYYTKSSNGAVSGGPGEALDNRLVRFAASGDVATGDEELIRSFPIGSPGIHNGGIFRFGPDGKIYVSVGDVGSPENSQSLAAPAGKIHRINDDGTIPADNPFGESSSVFALGVRNVFGLTFDGTGRLFGNENGPGNHDEVIIIGAGDNHGWPEVQGFADNGTGDPSSETDFAANNSNYRDPLVDKSDVSVGAAGIDICRSDVYGDDLNGNVFYGQYSQKRIVRLKLDAAGTAVLEQNAFGDDLPSEVIGMGFAPDGILWATTTSSVVRILPEP